MIVVAVALAIAAFLAVFLAAPVASVFHAESGILSGFWLFSFSMKNHATILFFESLLLLRRPATLDS